MHARDACVSQVKTDTRQVVQVRCCVWSTTERAKKVKKDYTLYMRPYGITVYRISKLKKYGKRRVLYGVKPYRRILFLELDFIYDRERQAIGRSLRGGVRGLRELAMIDRHFVALCLDVTVADIHGALDPVGGGPCEGGELVEELPLSQGRARGGVVGSPLRKEVGEAGRWVELARGEIA